MCRVMMPVCLLLTLMACDTKKGVKPDAMTVTASEQNHVPPDAARDLSDPMMIEAHDMSFASLRLQDAHIVFSLIQPEGLSVNEDFECLEQDRAPEQFLEVMACWHAGHGWLDVRHCVHDGLKGQTAYPWGAPASFSSSVPVTLGDSGEVCEREQMKSGCEFSGAVAPPLWEVPLWIVHDSTVPIPASPCVLKRAAATENRDWAKARLSELRPQLGSWIGGEAAASCDAALFDDAGDILPWALVQLASPDDEVDITASGVLSFPGAAEHRIAAVRSIDMRRRDRGQECSLSLVWGSRDGVWSLLGINESMNFTSTRPFGHGQLDISKATCSDLNADGSPELWFHSGSETEGGWSFVDLGGDAPRWLFSRYTGD